jgi:hypothetical protein
MVVMVVLSRIDCCTAHRPLDPAALGAKSHGCPPFVALHNQQSDAWKTGKPAAREAHERVLEHDPEK